MAAKADMSLHCHHRRLLYRAFHSHPNAWGVEGRLPCQLRLLGLGHSRGGLPAPLVVGVPVGPLVVVGPGAVLTVLSSCSQRHCGHPQLQPQRVQCSKPQAGAPTLTARQPEEASPEKEHRHWPAGWGKRCS